MLHMVLDTGEVIYLVFNLYLGIDNRLKFFKLINLRVVQRYIVYPHVKLEVRFQGF